VPIVVLALLSVLNIKSAIYIEKIQFYRAVFKKNARAKKSFLGEVRKYCFDEFNEKVFL
jgi:hypothetical protein